MEGAVRIRVGLVAASFAATLAVAQGGDPLAPFALGKSGPGWGEVLLGTSLVKAERLTRSTLAIGPGDSRPVCSEFAAEADYEGIWLVLGFPSAKPGAKIESIWVRFEGELVAATRDELVESLRRRAPEMTWVPDPEHPEDTEASDPTPVFRVAASPDSVVKLYPREGMLIARRDCLGRSG